jgi:hypothetical protein
MFNIFDNTTISSTIHHNSVSTAISGASNSLNASKSTSFASKLKEIEALAISKAKQQLQTNNHNIGQLKGMRKGNTNYSAQNNKGGAKKRKNKETVGGRVGKKKKFKGKGANGGISEGGIGEMGIISADEGEGMEDLSRFKGKRLEKVREGWELVGGEDKEE